VTFTLPGAPMIYAGQERGNETYRGPVRWHDGDNDLTEFHRELAALRDVEPLLRHGTVEFDGAASEVTVVDGETDRVTAYERAADDPDGDTLLVVVNFGDSAATVTVPDGVETDLFGGATRINETGTVKIDSVAVLTVEPSSDPYK